VDRLVEKSSIKVFNLLDASGNPYISDTKGTIGGHRELKIYGRLDCPSALRFIRNGQYKYRVFFADEDTAIAAGYRPCENCIPKEYAKWKETN